MGATALKRRSNRETSLARQQPFEPAFPIKKERASRRFLDREGGGRDLWCSMSPRCVGFVSADVPDVLELFQLCAHLKFYGLSDRTESP